MIKDFKGRLFLIISANKQYTFLECAATGDLIKVKSDGMKSMGFLV